MSDENTDVEGEEGEKVKDTGEETKTSDKETTTPDKPKKEKKKRTKKKKKDNKEDKDNEKKKPEEDNEEDEEDKECSIEDFKEDLDKIGTWKSEVITDTKSFSNGMGNGLAAAAASLHKTRELLLKEAADDPALHLMLYTNVQGDDRKLLPWWSEALRRMAIAQQVIRIGVQNNEIPSLTELQEKYPMESEKTLQHVLNAVENHEMVNIMEQLTADPDQYRRLALWGKEKAEYLKICIDGFLSCYAKEYKPMYTQTVEGETRIVENLTDGTIGVKIDDEEVGVNLKSSDTFKHYSNRESMVWFSREVTNLLMFDFDWNSAIEWSKFVYKSLTLV